MKIRSTIIGLVSCMTVLSLSVQAAHMSSHVQQRDLVVAEKASPEEEVKFDTPFTQEESEAIEKFLNLRKYKAEEKDLYERNLRVK